jgi:curli production assembly/transport component CsgE
MWPRRLLPGLLTALLIAAPVWGSDDGLDGLVINQAATRFGQEFYVEFVKYWNEYQIVTPASLIVHERPSARWGSAIWIEYRGRNIFKRNVGAGIRDLDALAKMAAERVFTVILQERNAFNGGSDAFEQDDSY